MADELMKHGCKLVTNGTDNHLMVVDCVKSFGSNGTEIEKVLDHVHITTSKSTIPDDTRPPFSPSGLRLGTPAMTTRGLKEDGMRKIAGWIVEAAQHRSEPDYLKKLGDTVKEYCLQFPIPGA